MRQLTRLPIAMLLCLLLFLMFSSSGYTAGQYRVLAVKSVDHPAYQKVVDEFDKRLEALCPVGDCSEKLEIRAINLTDYELTSQLWNPDLVIPIGRSASLKVADVGGRHRTIFSLIPSKTWQELQDCCLNNNQLSDSTAIFLDQPIKRRVALAKLAFPGKNRIGVISSTEQAGAEVAKVIREMGLVPVQMIVTEDKGVGYHLNRMIGDVDVLLTTPESAIYNRENLPNILLTTYRGHLPVVGFSRAYVNAGAVLAVYTSPEDVGRQLGEVVWQTYKNNMVLPATAYAEYFHIAINKDVAASLGIVLPSAQSLENQLRSGVQ